MSESKLNQSSKECENTYFCRLKEVLGKHGAISSIVIRNGTEYGYDIEGADVEGVYSKEQLESLRYILITVNRQKAQDKAMNFVACDQKINKIQMFDMNKGNSVVRGIPKQIKGAMGQASEPQKFDALLALTCALKDVNGWIENNELSEVGGKCERVIRRLAAAWSKLLAKSDEELGKLNFNLA